MAAEPISLYDDFATFLAGLSPEKILAYYAPDKVQQRVDYLVEQKKEDRITTTETEELEKYFLLEHLVRLAKARAAQLLATA